MSRQKRQAVRAKERRRKRLPLDDNVPQSPLYYAEFVSDLIHNCSPEKVLQEKGITTNDDRKITDTALKGVRNLFRNMKHKRSNEVKGVKNTN